MALNKLKLDVTGSGSRGTLVAGIYENLSDDRATMEASGYFNGASKELFRCGLLLCFASDATFWATVSISGSTVTISSTITSITQGTALADLAGTLTGTVDGTLADVADIALSTSNTYTDAAVNSAVNAAILSVNLQLKELQTKLNAVLARLRSTGVIAT